MDLIGKQCSPLAPPSGGKPELWGLSLQEPLKAHSPFIYYPLIELGQLDVIDFFACI